MLPFGSYQGPLYLASLGALGTQIPTQAALEMQAGLIVLVCIWLVPSGRGHAVRVYLAHKKTTTPLEDPPRTPLEDPPRTPLES